MSFSRVPESFMEGVFLAPHNFNDPQNPQHGEYVNMQLRNDLYFSTLEQISRVEFGLINWGKKQWVQVEQMKPCEGKVQWYGEYSDALKKKSGRALKDGQDEQNRVELLSCQDWQVAYHKDSQVSRTKYRVHVYQSQTDIFKSQIYPPTLWKTFKDLLIN